MGGGGDDENCRPHGDQLSVSSADRVWVVAGWSSGSMRRTRSFSILGGSSVGGGRGARTGTPVLQRFQYPRRIECGWWQLRRVEGVPLPRLSVSSADRVWVVAHPAFEVFRPSRTFSILGGSSVGGGCVDVWGINLESLFQYPRRIECGWWERSAAGL